MRPLLATDRRVVYEDVHQFLIRVRVLRNESPVHRDYVAPRMRLRRGIAVRRSASMRPIETHRQGADMASLPGVPGVAPARRRYDHVRRKRIQMPLFMDRHDVPGVTAEQVAQAHLADLDMGAKFGVQFLAYWFDADQGEAFCLAKGTHGRFSNGRAQGNARSHP